MLRQSLPTYCLLIAITCLGLLIGGLPAQASAIDPYVTQYMRVFEPVPVKLDGHDQTRLFSPEDLSKGKHLFEENCKNCHVGGATLPDPTIPLSLTALQGSSPPRDNLTSLVAYLRQPMTYDGTEESYWCRQVPDTWMSQTEIENLSAFILKAAENVPGWGPESF
ncbi:MAG: photosystem II cytochrome PsbV2 [Cyanothece sp. SIO1E1]|nr:photosystem II cytochrome PsbV2 [Cyanothece sp. SIO1E1]